MDNKSFLLRAGAFLIVFCVSALVSVLVYSFYKRSTRVVDNVTIQFVMPVDSLGIVVPEALQSVEDLKNEIARHEQLLEDKYKYMLEQKENMNDLLSIGGMFLAVILGLFGFFGYKSMNSIEEKVEKEARNIAEETSKNKFDSYSNSTTNYLNKEIDSKISVSMDNNLALLKMSTKKQMEGILNEKIKDFSQKDKDQDENIANISKSIGALEHNFSQLSERVRLLEKGENKPTGKRRSLSNGGMKG